jgi:hypothetical protein
MSEGELLQLAEDFKNIVASKNEIITNLKKCIISAYGLVRIMDLTDDYSSIEILRTYLSSEIEAIIEFH